MNTDPNKLITDLARQFARQNVALWLAPDWSTPAEELTAVAAQPWLAVWSEARDRALVRAMADRADEARIVSEVAGAVEDVLGDGYEIAGIRPVFFLNGTDEEPEGEEGDFEVRERRLGKLKQLRRLDAAVLLVDGYRDAVAVNARLREEILPAGKRLLAVVVLGAPEAQAASLIEDPRIRWLPVPLPELIREFERQVAARGEGDIVQVGPFKIGLRPLLQTEPPLDQDFYVLTRKDTAPPTDVSDKELLDELLTGRVPPWGAITRNLLWARRLPHRDRVFAALNRVAHGDTRVATIDIVAEPGAGLTVLLHEMAVEAAKEGYPTLFHRGRVGATDYNLLRRFLTDLYAAPELKSKDDKDRAARWPALLVFDTPSVLGDALGRLDDLPERLAHDHRRVVVLRAVPVQSSAPDRGDCDRTGASEREAVASEPFLPILRAALTDGEREQLTAWARNLRTAQVLQNGQIDAIGGWDTTAGVPLFYALYHILRQDLDAARHLGRHLVRDLNRVLEPDEGAEAGSSDGNAPLSGAALAAAVARLNASLYQLKRARTRSDDEYRATYLALAAFGCLGVRAPRDVLAAVAGVKSEGLGDVISRMAAPDKAVAAIDAPEDDTGPGGRTAPGAFYTAPETVSLRHIGFGPMILDYLKAPADGAEDPDRAALLKIPLGRMLTEQFAEKPEPGQIQLKLLSYVLGKLDRKHVGFIESLAARFLRLQWRERTPLDNWKRNHRNAVYQALNQFVEDRKELVYQNPALLHTAAITAYKSCDDDSLKRPGNVGTLNEVRRRYQQAVDWTGHALEHVRSRYTSENPGNLYVTLGLVYKSWAWREEAEARATGNASGSAAARRYKAEALKALRLGYQEKDNNVFAAYGLASYLVEVSQELLSADPEANAADIARHLSEAVTLLQRRPEEYFRSEWDELKKKAIGLLDGPEARRVIAQLINRREELGFALMALQELKNEIPTGPIPIGEPGRQGVDRAAGILSGAEQLSPRTPSELADLLRYALFLAHQTPGGDPEFERRFRLLRTLERSALLDDPIWMYDFAMLAFQVREYRLAEDTFRKLRRGRRFMDVPLGRAVHWMEAANPRAPKKVGVKVTSLSPTANEAWGTIVEPRDVTFEAVKFLVRDFVSRRGRDAVQVGRVLTGFIRLDRSGPIFVPEAG